MVEKSEIQLPYPKFPGYFPGSQPKSCFLGFNGRFLPFWNVDVVQALISADYADVEACLWFSVANSCKNGANIVQVLVNASANVHSVNEDGMTVLMCSSKHGTAGVIQGLTLAKANVNAMDKNCCTALFWCIQYGKSEALHALLSAGANVNAVDKDDRTPLMYAVGTKYYMHYSRDVSCVFVETLLSGAADVHAKDCSGSTALMFAATDGCAGTIQLLINAQSCINSFDEYGRTALVLAQENNNDEVVQLLAVSGYQNLGVGIKFTSEKSEEDIIH